MHSILAWFKVLTVKEKIAAVIAIVIAVLSGLALLTLFYFKNTVSVPQTGGEYREGIVGQPAFLNPVLAKSGADKAMTELLFANLPDLADNIEVKSDARSVRVHLKEGLLWSDNQEITADDVIFTIKSIQDPDTNSPLLPAWRGVNVERISKLEVNFKLPAPYVFFTDNFYDLRLIPKHLFSGIPPANWRLSEYNLRPISSGAYIAANSMRGTDGFFSAMQFKANPSAPKNTPYISDFVIRFFRNRDELIKEFNAGRIDGFFSSAPEDLALIKRPYQPIGFTSPVYYAVFWNQSASTALTDKEVRRALDLAVDRNRLVKEVLDGRGASSTDPLSPTFFPIISATSSFDPETAKGILNRSGWTTGEDGFLIKKTKKTETRLEFTLTVPDTSYLVKTANILAEEWKAIGVNARVNVLPLDSIMNDSIKNRTYEALLFGNTLERSGDLYAFWHSTERFYPGLNLSLYKNSKADSLIDAVRKEVNPEKRSAKMDELRTLIASEEPAVFLYSPTYIYATSKRVKGITPAEITDASERFNDVPSWYLETKRILKK